MYVTDLWSELVFDGSQDKICLLVLPCDFRALLEVMLIGV